MDTAQLLPILSRSLTYYSISYSLLSIHSEPVLIVLSVNKREVIAVGRSTTITSLTKRSVYYSLRLAGPLAPGMSVTVEEPFGSVNVRTCIVAAAAGIR